MLAQETSAISTTESAETRIIDFVMARTVVDAAGQFNHTAPCAVKRAGILDVSAADREDSGLVNNLFFQVNFFCQKVRRANFSRLACAISRGLRAYLFANSNGRL